jgi:hypothetical protein
VRDYFKSKNLINFISVKTLKVLQIIHRKNKKSGILGALSNYKTERKKAVRTKESLNSSEVPWF